MPVPVSVGCTHIEYKLAYSQCRYRKGASQFFYDFLSSSRQPGPDKKVSLEP